MVGKSKKEPFLVKLIENLLKKALYISIIVHKVFLYHLISFSYCLSPVVNNISLLINFSGSFDNTVGQFQFKINSTITEKLTLLFEYYSIVTFFCLYILLNSVDY